MSPESATPGGTGGRGARPPQARPPSSRRASSRAFSSGTTCFTPAPSPRRRRRPRARAPRRRMRSVASRVPTTPGMPYSRATIAGCERRPPLSVTIAPSSGSRMLNASVVDSVTRTSPSTIRSNSEGSETRRAGPRRRRRSPRARAAGAPRARASELPNSAPIAMPIARMTRGAGRKAGRVRRRRRRRAEGRRGVLGAVATSGTRTAPPARRRRARPRRQQRAHLVEAGVDEVLGVVDPALRGEPAAPASAARRMRPEAQMSLKTPALVADPVGQPGLLEQLVELARCSAGTFPADLGDRDPRRPTRRRPSPTTARGSRGAARPATRARRGSRCRSRRAAGSRRGRDRRTSPRRSRPRASAGARAPARDRPRRRAARGREDPRLAAISRSSSLGGARRHGRRAAHQAEQLGGRESVQSPTCARKSPTGASPRR